MLYAATRNTLTKSLGSAHFTDSIFATSKDDVTAESYARHKQHLAAPKPMSAREKEMAAVKAAERQAGGSQYEGSRARQNHVGQGVGLKWTEDVENAVQELGHGEGSAIVVLVSKLRKFIAPGYSPARTEYRFVFGDVAVVLGG